MFQDFTESDGWEHELSDQVDKKIYRRLETKEDVLKVLTEEYLKEYKEEEQWYVDTIFKTKTEVKNLRIKKKRLDTKTKDYEKQVKSLKKDLNKLTKQIDKLDEKISDRKKTSEELDRVIVTRVRFFGGSGRGGFEITGRIWKDDWNELSSKLDRQPTKEDVLPLILPKIQSELKQFFNSDKFTTYLRKKTKPIGSGYGKYKRKK